MQARKHILSHALCIIRMSFCCYLQLPPTEVCVHELNQRCCGNYFHEKHFLYVRVDDAASMLVCLLAALVANLLDCQTCSAQSKLHDINCEELIPGILCYAV